MNFVSAVGGQVREHLLLQFHRGQSYHLDPPLKAALLAAGAPMTAA